MRLAIESLATYKPLAADMTTLLAIGRASIGAWKAKEAAARVRAILRSDLLLICSLSFICSQTLFSTVKCTENLSKTRECSRRSQDVLCLLDQCLRHASFPSFINGVRKFVHSSSELRLVEILGAESLHHLFDCP
jgi:hypothetical protein